MSVTEILRWAYSVMEYPWALILIIPLILIIAHFLRKTYIELKEDVQVKKSKTRVRKIMFFTRSIIIILLVIALASPYVLQEKIIEGDPFVQLLVDNSTSMEVLEDISQQLITGLEKKVNTEVKLIGSGTSSNIGDSVLSHLEPYGSILLLSDGNANIGANLGDVALFASKINASINAINLKAVKNDVGVEIIGPSKTLEDAEVTFTVFLNRVGNIEGVPLKVTIDDEIIIDEESKKNSFQFTRQLSKGVHKVVAEIALDDHFKKNNRFYKTVRVVEKPKVLLYTEKSSPMEELLKQLYVVEKSTSLPNNLNEYYAVVVNDIDATTLDPVTDVLNDYVADGNGMVVFGGENSYDMGDYRHSLFETMLPVMVGAPERKEGDVLLAVVIDISGSQGAAFGRFESTADFSKSATIDIMRNLKVDTRVAVIAFNTQAYLLSELTPAFTKQGVEGLIARLKWGGGTSISAGLMKAISVLGAFSGSKNVVLLSDGKTQAQASAYEAAKYAANAGIKVYTVGVGPTTDEQLMMDIAEITNGIYFRATEETRLKILFGPVDEDDAQSGQMELVILNKNHFITANVEPQAALHGFNQVSPKGAGRLLATTSTGEPVLTVWRLGLGRVAAYTVDDGSKWGGSLLGAKNSRLISRTMNWAMGDPERKSASFIDAADSRLDEPAVVTVRSETPPSAEGVTFYKIDEDTYTGNIIPQSTGFQDVASAVFAVNYESEFSGIGVNPELAKIAASTGGRIFEKSDIDGIVAHAKTKAKRSVNAKEYVRWPFIILAIIIFILEIFIRRIMRRE